MYVFFNEVKKARGNLENSGILGCQCVSGRPGGSCSIPFIVFEVSRA